MSDTLQRGGLDRLSAGQAFQFSLSYSSVDTLRLWIKNKEGFSVSSVKKKKNDVSHSLLRKTLSFDSPSGLRKLRGWDLNPLRPPITYNSVDTAAFFDFLFFSFTDNEVSYIFLLFKPLRFLKLISSPVTHSIHYVFEQLKSLSTHYVPDSLVWTVSSFIH